MEAIRPHNGLLEAHRELELIQHVAAADHAEKLRVLVDEAPRVLRVGWCTVVELTEAGPRRVVGSVGAPEKQAASTPWMPISTATALDVTEDWVPQLWQDMDTSLARGAAGRSADRDGAGPARRSSIPAVRGGQAGLSGRDRREPRPLAGGGRTLGQ